MDQLDTIMSHLSQAPFNKIETLFEDDNGGFSVGECLSPVLTWQSRDALETDIERGPFAEESSYLQSLISALTSHAEELPLTPYLFFSPLPKPADYPTWDSFRAATDRRSDFIGVCDKLEGSKNRLDYCIAGQLLEEMVPRLSSDSTAFTISHPDLHTGNIFVDEDLNITSIIDWGSATAGPVTELLATPGLASSSKLPSVALTATFQAGFSQESPNISRDMWERAEMMWCFSRVVRLLSGQDLPLFQRLYNLVYKTGVENPPNSRDYGWLFHQRAMTPSNKQLLSKLREDDLTDDEVKEREKVVFSGNKLDRLAVARKLTVMSEMNPGFIGDRRLWRWIEGALKGPVYDSINDKGCTYRERSLCPIVDLILVSFSCSCMGVLTWNYKRIHLKDGRQKGLITPGTARQVYSSGRRSKCVAVDQNIGSVSFFLIGKGISGISQASIS